MRPTSLVLAAFLLADPARAEPCVPHFADRSEAAAFLDDLSIHYACSSAAETRVLGFAEARACSTAFRDVKLAFLPGVRAGRSGRLSMSARVRAGRKGYRLFKCWEAKNPETIDALRAGGRPGS